MKYCIILIALCISFPVMAQQNFVQMEYAPNSNHLSNDDAPAAGYNEDNNIVIIKLGREYDLNNNNWKYALSAGYTHFKNSYGKKSNGLGVGAEAIYLLGRDVSLYGGGDFGFVSGYENNVNNDYVIFDRYIPFLTLNAGLEYEFNEYLPTLRIGGKYVPGSVVDSDDVVALTIGSRLKF